MHSRILVFFLAALVALAAVASPIPPPVTGMGLPHLPVSGYETPMSVASAQEAHLTAREIPSDLPPYNFGGWGTWAKGIAEMPICLFTLGQWCKAVGSLDDAIPAQPEHWKRDFGEDESTSLEWLKHKKEDADELLIDYGIFTSNWLSCFFTLGFECQDTPYRPIGHHDDKRKRSIWDFTKTWPEEKSELVELTRWIGRDYVCAITLMIICPKTLEEAVEEPNPLYKAAHPDLYQRSLDTVSQAEQEQLSLPEGSAPLAGRSPSEGLFETQEEEDEFFAEQYLRLLDVPESEWEQV